MSKLKVALLFAGQPRFITNPYTYSSHKREILDKYTFDVFAHCWFDKDAAQFSYNEWSRMDNCPVNPEAINIIKNQYSPHVLKVDKPQTFSLSDKSRAIVDGSFPNNPVFNERNVGNALSYLYSLEKVAEAYERSEKMFPDDKHDFVIVSRFDSIIYRLPDLTKLNSDHFYLSDHHPNWPDLLFICGPKYVKGLKCFSNVDKIIEGNLRHGESFGEQIKAINMTTHCREMWAAGDKTCSIQPVPLPVRIVRDLAGKGDEDALGRYGLTNEERFVS